MQCLLWEASIAQAHGEADNTLYKLLAVTQWLVCILITNHHLQNILHVSNS